MNKLYVNSFAERSIQSGVQLLEERDFKNLTDTDQLVELYTKNNKPLGTAYLSKQNKGIGWFLGKNIQNLSLKYFEDILYTAKTKRTDFFASKETNAFRIFNQEGDNFGGLTIDWYDGYLVISLYNTFVMQNKSLIVEATKNVFPEAKGAYEKLRYKEATYESAFLFGQEAPETFLIIENKVKYQVFMNDGLMTGIFLDQHDIRRYLTEGIASGKKVLNMFSYTAAFSVAAAIGGAVETRSVDLAKRSRELSQAHFIANGLDLENHYFHVMDVFEYYRYAKRKELKFDIIVIDPPSFARNKKQTFSVTKDYHKLIAETLDILNPGGTIIASTNASNMSVQQFKKEIQKGFGNSQIESIHLNQLPSDFTVNEADERSNYLKVFTIKVKK